MIEFHRAEYHESPAELNEPSPFIPIRRRAFHWVTEGPIAYRLTIRAARLFQVLQDCHARNQDRLRELWSRVKNLCAPIDCLWGLRDEGEKGILVWYLLPYFVNLETLELQGDTVGEESWEQHVEEITAPPLPSLRFAKLSAYIPRQVAQWVIKSGASLERLEIALLDRPISTCVSSNPRFKPLTVEKLGEDSDGESDYGSLYGEAVIPRPLGNFLPDDAEPFLPRLKFLYLCSPVDCPDRYSLADYSWSTRAEKACLADWRRLLLASSLTLETLVLEQRPGALYEETEKSTAEEYLRENKDGSINKALVRAVEDVLVDRDAFPVLRCVYLYGFAVGENSRRRPTDKAHGGRLMLNLERRGVRCEARLGQWCYFEKRPGYISWDHLDQDDDEDEDEDAEDDEEEEEEEKDRWDTLLAQV
ncbi:hypothetical protein ACJ41O_006198 [Fusarium nematophilum]